MKIIIPMAGRGSRLRPHTLTVPKPLIPIAIDIAFLCFHFHRNELRQLIRNLKVQPNNIFLFSSTSA